MIWLSSILSPSGHFSGLWCQDALPLGDILDPCHGSRKVKVTRLSEDFPVLWKVGKKRSRQFVFSSTFRRGSFLDFNFLCIFLDWWTDLEFDRFLIFTPSGRTRHAIVFGATINAIYSLSGFEWELGFWGLMGGRIPRIFCGIFRSRQPKRCGVPSSARGGTPGSRSN